ncbi:unnamed protein product [Lactuca saligna]|uniref:MULE transposase domain-containing protein n=1 Tax=Lactuca saligna TaxID=75948 RepID=A0AA35YDC7_LACSI|nr:unnamed protein product [Lactuca saligna]
MERLTGEKCENFSYCLLDIDFPKGLRLIRNENDYSTFISILCEYGVELPFYVDHFGTTNMQEWLDEKREEVVDTIHEEVVDDLQDDGETDEIWHTDDNANPHFFKKDNDLDCEIRENIGEGEPVDVDMGENEDDEADVSTDLRNIFNKGQPWKEPQPVLGRDANNGIFPIAWVGVCVENKDNWKWFIDNLTEYLNLQCQGFGVVLIPKQHKV